MTSILPWLGGQGMTLLAGTVKVMWIPYQKRIGSTAVRRQEGTWTIARQAKQSLISLSSG